MGPFLTNDVAPVVRARARHRRWSLVHEVAREPIVARAVQPFIPCRDGIVARRQRHTRERPGAVPVGLTRLPSLSRLLLRRRLGGSPAQPASAVYESLMAANRPPQSPCRLVQPVTHAMARRQAAYVAITTFLTGASVALLVLSPFGNALDRELGAWLAIRLRGPIEAPPGAVVIAQDHASARALGLPGRLGGWPRRHLARVIEQASAAGARIIVLDLFLDGSQAETDDAALERAITASGRVVLVERMNSGEAAQTGAIRVLEEQIIPPLARFRAGARVMAPLPLPQERWRVAAFWTFKAGTGGKPTLPAAALLGAAFADSAARAAIGEAAAAEGLANAAPTAAEDASRFVLHVDRLRQLLADDPVAERIVARIAAADLGDPAAGQLAIAAIELLAGAESRLLVPYGPAGHLPRVAYHRIVAGDPAALGKLRDQVVFIGASDLHNQAEADIFRTVFSRQDGIELAGVEIAATAFLNLLQGDAACPATPAWNTFLVAGSAIGAMLAGLTLHPALALATATTIGGVVSAASVPALEAYRVTLPLGSLLIVALPLGLVVGWLMQRSLARRHLDHAVGILTRGRARKASHLSGLARAGRRETRWVVCLASDLAGYVRLTESMLSREPALAELLARYRGIVHEVVQRHGGIVLDFTGDASMCLWDADRPSAALRAEAIEAALELVERLHHFTVTHELREHHTRVGLAEGTIVLGNIDHDGHFFFGGVGEPLNVAARLEQLNKQLGTYVLATAAVAQGLDRFPIRPIGPVALKGMAQPEEIVAIELPSDREPSCK
jgi:adenylate cyclase